MTSQLDASSNSNFKINNLSLTLNVSTNYFSKFSNFRTNWNKIYDKLKETMRICKNKICNCKQNQFIMRLKYKFIFIEQKKFIKYG